MAPNSTAPTTEVPSQPQYYKRPFTERVVSRLTGFEMEPRPRGEPCTLRLRHCSFSFVREDHYIGQERTTTKLKRVDEPLETHQEQQEVAHPAAVFQTKTACHGAILQMLLPALIQCYDDDDDDDVQRNEEEEGRWDDELVPAGLVERIVQLGAAGGGSYACDVRMDVEVTRVYSEAVELLLLCETVSSMASHQRAPGAGDACPICMEELGYGGVTGLPCCSQAFHRDCILQWFGKAPTCPCCRRCIVSLCIADE